MPFTFPFKVEIPLHFMFQMYNAYFTTTTILLSPSQSCANHLLAVTPTWVTGNHICLLFKFFSTQQKVRRVDKTIEMNIK